MYDIKEIDKIDRPLAQRDPHDARTVGDISSIVLIDGRTLERESLMRNMRETYPGAILFPYATADDWLGDPDAGAPDVILFNIAVRRVSEPAVLEDLKRIVKAARPSPVLIASAVEELPEMLKALDAGARGYISSSLGIEAAMRTLHFAAAGGVYLPAESILSVRDTLETRTEPTPSSDDFFSVRQAAVMKAIRRGKSNKIIAYELNLCENTVKAHVRAIMKKLDAKNRTEAAFKISRMFPQDCVEDAS